MDKKKLITSLVFIIIVGVVIISLTVSKKSYAVGATLVDTVKALNKGDDWNAGDSGVYATSAYLPTINSMKSEYHEYRYIGAEVNNYVKFNNDLYRIIGVFDSNSHGVENTEMVKLIRDRALSSYSWGVYNTDSSTGTCSGYANDWTGKTTTSPANLNVLFNEYFYNKKDTSNIYGECLDWTYYSASNDTKTNDCADILAYGINDDIREYIEETTWYISGSSEDQCKQDWYSCERGHSCTNAYLEIGSAKSKIGLMYLSDYLYASGYYSSSDMTTNNALYFGSENWLYSSSNEWTMTVVDDDYSVWYIENGGGVYSDAIMSYTFRPTFYLKSSVYVTGGDGSFDNPYTLGCDNCTE